MSSETTTDDRTDTVKNDLLDARVEEFTVRGTSFCIGQTVRWETDDVDDKEIVALIAEVDIEHGNAVYAPKIEFDDGTIGTAKGISELVNEGKADVTPSNPYMTE